MISKVLTSVALAVIGTASFAQDWVQWPVNGHWYRVVRASNGISWTQAQAAAKTWGGYLATPTSSAENNFVFGLIKNLGWWEVQDGVNSFGPWIGLYQLPGSQEPAGGFTWASGEQSGFRNWMAGEPNNNHGLGGEDKVHMLWNLNNPQPFWNDLKNAPGTGETMVRGYVVETDGWVKWPVNGHWYRPMRSNAALSWSQAKSLSQNLGGYLATPTSLAENDHVFSMISSTYFWNGPRGPWIGGYQDPTQVDPSLGWHWLSGETWDFTSWAPGQPDDTLPTEDKLQYFNLAGVPAKTWNDLTDTANETVFSYVVEADKLSATVRPLAVTTDIGTKEAGTVDSLFNSDQSYFQVRSAVLNNPAQAPITVSATFSAVTVSPKQMSVTFRNRTSRTGLVQEVLLYNFVAKRWDTFDSRNATTYDFTVAANIASPANYVRQTDRMVLVRWRIKRSNGSQSETWRSYADRVAITIVR